MTRNIGQKKRRKKKKGYAVVELPKQDVERIQDLLLWSVSVPCESNLSVDKFDKCIRSNDERQPSTSRNQEIVFDFFRNSMPNINQVVTSSLSILFCFVLFFLFVSFKKDKIYKKKKMKFAILPLHSRVYLDLLKPSHILSSTQEPV